MKLDTNSLAHTKWNCKYHKLHEDREAEQLSIKEYIDPFTGEPVKEGK